MAEVLGLAASIISVIQITGTAIQYLNDVKGATEDRTILLIEIGSTRGILDMLKNLAESEQSGEQWAMTIQSLSVPSGPLEQFSKALERLISKLKPASGMMKGVKALTWSFKKEEIKEILSTIERQKTFFNLAMQNDHMYAAPAFPT